MHMKLLNFFVLTFLIISCSSPKVAYDFDTNTDFSQYKTYNYATNLQTGLSPLDEKRLIQAVDASMVNKGFTKTENPSVYIDIQTKQFAQRNGNSVGIGLGGGSRGIGGGISVGLPVGKTKTNQELVLNIIDNTNKQLLWQAIGESALKEGVSPEEKQLHYTNLVVKIFEKYPPNSTK